MNIRKVNSIIESMCGDIIIITTKHSYTKHHALIYKYIHIQTPMPTASICCKKLQEPNGPLLEFYILF